MNGVYVFDNLQSADRDRALGFTIASRHARGRVVRLGPVLDAILSAHSYPPVIAQLLAEALTLAALLGTMLKDADGQLTLQAQTENGVVELLVCAYKGGELRGYVKYDAAQIGRESCGERVVQYGWISVVAVSLQNN